ncbi:hypothetical protein, partial [Enterobacter intestinihominis]
HAALEAGNGGAGGALRLVRVGDVVSETKQKSPAITPDLLVACLHIFLESTALRHVNNLKNVVSAQL